MTGLDFSEPAVQAASGLARDIGLDPRFVASDVYDAPAALNHAMFDIVYTGVGARCWLPDMKQWAEVIRDLLRPGGQFDLFAFHPAK